MRKLPLCLAIVTVSYFPLAAFAEVHDARAMARGGVGLTMGEYNQALKNPALISQFDKNDDFSFGLNVGVLASDKEGMLQALDDAQTAIDNLETGKGSASAVNQELKNLDNKMVQADVGTSLMIAIPNTHLPLALIVKGGLSFGTQFSYKASDTLVLNAIQNKVLCPSGKVCSSDDLKSSLNASAVGLYDYGVMMGKQYENGLQLGTTLKVQRIELLAYSANASNFDTADINDSNIMKSYNSVNMDLGGMIHLGEQKQFIIAGAVENLVPRTFDGPITTLAGTSEYRLSPVVTTAVGYSNTYFKAEANVDLTPRHGFDQLLETQFARLGVELSAGRHFHLRAGYRSDMKSNVSDTFSVGLGITPWDRLNIDLAAVAGDGDTAGVGLQLGFKI